MAESLVSDLGEDQVGKAYFQGNLEAYRSVLAALSSGKDRSAFSNWHTHVNSSDHKDWKTAATELHAALSSRK
jgi:hypothetical protein